MINTKSFYEGTDNSPAFICDLCGNFLIANKYAENLSLISLLKTNIAEYVSGEDALRYDLIMNSKKPRPFIAAAKLVCGKRFLCVIPHKISDCRIAMVVIKESLEKAQSFISSTDPDLLYNIQGIINELIDLNALTSSYTHSALFDARKAAELITIKMKEEKLTDHPLNLHLPHSIATSEAFMCDIGLGSFISALASVIFALSNASSSAPIDISLQAEERGFSLAFETTLDKGYANKEELLHKHFDFLRFALECSDCLLKLSVEDSKIKASCTFSDISHCVDFKSSAPFASFTELFKRSMALTLAIYKGASPEEE